MRARIEDGCFIITDVYEPPVPRPSPIPLGWKVFFTVAALFIVCCALAGLNY